jgi:hypothetical protein
MDGRGKMCQKFDEGLDDAGNRIYCGECPECKIMFRNEFFDEYRNKENLSKLDSGFCPSKQTCVLRVYERKVVCLSHERDLIIKNNWENKTESISMRHVLYIAMSNGVDGEVLIDEEM